ncbi:MAG: hypothetical protein Q8T11_05135 [Elusimicrobiota bacterium]|nr:hypothetical protein [Elusimicrobiota bacterium]
MIDTERSLQSVARLHDEILRERAEGLHEAAQTAKARLAEREKALSRLRAQVASLKASLAPAPAPAPVRSVPTLPAPTAVPAKEAPANSAIPKTSIPRTAGWSHIAPYAAIAACALLLELGGARRTETASPNIALLAHPAPAPVTGGRPAAKGAPVVVDDDRSQEALLLVHEWKLPGDDKSLGERLGGEHELPGGRPYWRVERTAEHGYRVTFQPAPKDLPYAFEADIEARVVWPTPETQELLAPRFTAAFRDAVR